MLQAKQQFRRRRSHANNTREVVAPSTISALFDQLVAADLTAAGYRVALDTISRLLRQQRPSEAVPVQWVADRLALHRNAVGSAYQAIDRAGVLKRTAVPDRGAPTRTSLTGVALACLHALTGPDRTTVTVTISPDVRDQAPGPDRTRDMTLAPTAGDVPTPVTRSSTSEPTEAMNLDDDEPRWSTVEADAPPTGSCWSGPDQSTNSHDENGERDPAGARAGGPDRTTTTHPVTEHATASGPSGPTGPESTSDAAFLFDPAIHETMCLKVPGDVRYAVMQMRRGSPLTIDPHWGLTSEEEGHLRALMHKPEAPVARKKQQPTAPTAPATSTVRALLPRRVADEVFRNGYPRLIELLGNGAGQAMDEIAFMVATRNLGKGDVAGGVRAALSLVASRRWSTPRGMGQEWRGAVLRTLGGAMHEHAGDAHAAVL